MRLIESEKNVKIGHVRYQTTRHKFANQKMMSIWLSGSIVLYRTTPLVCGERFKSMWVNGHESVK